MVKRCIIQYIAICFLPSFPPFLPLRIKSEESILSISMSHDTEEGENLRLFRFPFASFFFFLYNQKEVPFLANLTPGRSPEAQWLKGLDTSFLLALHSVSLAQFWSPVSFKER